MIGGGRGRQVRRPVEFVCSKNVYSKVDFFHHSQIAQSLAFWSNLNLKCDLKHVNPEDFVRFMSRHGYRVNAGIEAVLTRYMSAHASYPTAGDNDCMPVMTRTLNPAVL